MLNPKKQAALQQVRKTYQAAHASAHAHYRRAYKQTLAELGLSSDGSPAQHLALPPEFHELMAEHAEKLHASISDAHSNMHGAASTVRRPN